MLNLTINTNMSKLVLRNILFTLAVFTFDLSAQSDIKLSSRLISEGDSLMNLKQYLPAIKKYKAAGIQEVTAKASLNMKIGKAYFFNKELDSAYTYYQKASEASYNEVDLKTLGQAQNNLGVIHTYRLEYAEALNSYQKALEAYVALKNDSLIGSTYYNIGRQYKELSIYDKAIEYIIEAVKTFEKSNQQSNLAAAYQILGNLFRSEKDYDQSIKYHRKALEIKEGKGDSLSVARSYNNIGNTYKEKKNYDLALEFYSKSLQLMKNNDGTERAVPLKNIGEIYLKRKEYDLAEGVLFEALDYTQGNNNRKSRASILTDIGRLKTHKKQYNEAISFLKEGREIAENEAMDAVLLDSYLYLKEYYESKGSFKEALEYYDLYINKKEDIYNAEKSRIAKEMQVRYDVEKKQQEIVLLSKENVIKEAELEKETFKNQALLLGVSLLLVLTVLLVYAYRQSRKNTELQKAYLHDTQHRTKNFLQTLISLFSFQANQIDDPKAKAAVKQGESRVNAMMMIHRSLSQTADNQAGNFNFSDYAEKLIHQLKATYQKPDNDVDMQLSLGEIYLDTDKATPLALIVNEVVSNAFKYGLANNDKPLLIVEMRKTDRTIRLRVKDNGDGISDIDIDQLKSSGLKLVRLFTRQLKGQLKINSNSGAEFLIEVEI